MLWLLRRSIDWGAAIEVSYPNHSQAVQAAQAIDG
jgi:hypothetical protein